MPIDQDPAYAIRTYLRAANSGGCYQASALTWTHGVLSDIVASGKASAFFQAATYNMDMSTVGDAEVKAIAAEMLAPVAQMVEERKAEQKRKRQQRAAAKRRWATAVAV